MYKKVGVWQDFSLNLFIGRHAFSSDSRDSADFPARNHSGDRELIEESPERRRRIRSRDRDRSINDSDSNMSSSIEIVPPNNAEPNMFVMGERFLFTELYRFISAKF